MSNFDYIQIDSNKRNSVYSDVDIEEENRVLKRQIEKLRPQVIPGTAVHVIKGKAIYDIIPGLVVSIPNYVLGDYDKNGSWPTNLSYMDIVCISTEDGALLDFQSITPWKVKFDVGIKAEEKIIFYVLAKNLEEQTEQEPEGDRVAEVSIEHFCTYCFKLFPPISNSFLGSSLSCPFCRYSPKLTEIHWFPHTGRQEIFYGYCSECKVACVISNFEDPKCTKCSQNIPMVTTYLKELFCKGCGTPLLFKGEYQQIMDCNVCGLKGSYNERPWRHTS